MKSAEVVFYALQQRGKGRIVESLLTYVDCKRTGEVATGVVYRSWDEAEKQILAKNRLLANERKAS